MVSIASISNSYDDVRDEEVSILEAKQWRTPEQEDRLSRLRLEQEFQRRVKETDRSRGDDPDAEITDTAAVGVAAAFA